MSVPLASCSSVVCVSPTALLLGPMTVFGSIFRAWPIPAVPQIPGGAEYERLQQTQTNSEAEGQTRVKRGPWGQGLGRAIWPGSYSLPGPEGKTLKRKLELEEVGSTLSLSTDSWPLLLPAPGGMCEHFYFS